MPSLRLEALQEKLLRAGIAPRHVQTYLAELRQHFDDLLRAETAAGLSGQAAFRAARARLGGDDELAAAMLAQPELRSLSARYPWAVFGIAPLVSLGLLIVAAVLAKGGLIDIARYEGALLSSGLKSFVTAWDWSMMYLLPLIVAAAFFCLGARQFMRMRCLVPGALLVVLLGTTVTSGTVLANLPHKSELTLGLGYDTDPPFLLRLAANIALVGIMSALYWLWQRRNSALPD